jgi:ribosomal protein L9
MKSLVGTAVVVFLSIFLIATGNAATSGSTVVQEDEAQVQKTESCSPQKSQIAPKNKAKLSKRNQAKIEQAESAKSKRCIIEKSGTGTK